MERNFSPVERFIDRIVEAGQVNAAGIAIAVDGEPVFHYVRGEAAPGRPASEQTLWPLASIAKSYTASAVMSLIEAGRLGMWSKPSAVFPAFTGDGREEITLRHLLTHTSGLPMGPSNSDELERAGASAESRVADVVGADGDPIDWGAQIGHPSYGVAATVSDLLHFLLHFDRNSELRLHSKAGLRTMSTDQTAAFRGDADGFPIGAWGAGFQLQSGWSITGLGASDSFGHLGGTGVVGWISPADAVSVAFVSNRYYSGDPGSTERLEQAVNLAIAAATAPFPGDRRAGFRG